MALIQLHTYRLVGEQLRYLVTSAEGTWVALLGWNAPAYHLKAREEYVQWSDDQRQARLHWIAQNSRFVILADRLQYPNLASKALAFCTARLSEDWLQEYGHPIVLVESFVDKQWFRGTCYKGGGLASVGLHGGLSESGRGFL